MSLIDKLIALLSGTPHPITNAPPPEPILPLYHPETVILKLGANEKWTIRDACEGTQIFGGTGSGKSSGSGRSIALSFLKRGYGGLVLTAKPDEREQWVAYCEETGRSADLVIFGPEEGYEFNFLEYEHKHGKGGAGLTNNIADLFANIVEPSQGASVGKDPYWHNAMKQLLRRAIDLVVAAEVTLSLPLLLDVIMSGPRSLAETEMKAWKDVSHCAKCLEKMQQSKTAKNQYDIEHTERFWKREFPALADRTRSSIVSMFSVVADGFMTGPIRQMFCTGLNVTPEDTHDGKIIVVDLPIEVYNEIGQTAQMVWKYCWQRATARRDPNTDGGRPVFLWADESQFFASSSDPVFQATARSKKACTVFLTQNLPTYYDKIGEHKTNALLGNFQTKIFHANGDHVTNTFAAETVARRIVSRSSSNTSQAGSSFGASETMDYIVPPAEFQRLLKGGANNQYCVEAIVFQAGRMWKATGESFVKAAFEQNIV